MFLFFVHEDMFTISSFPQRVLNFRLKKRHDMIVYRRKCVLGEKEVLAPSVDGPDGGRRAVDREESGEELRVSSRIM